MPYPVFGPVRTQKGKASRTPTVPTRVDRLIAEAREGVATVGAFPTVGLLIA